MVTIGQVVDLPYFEVRSWPDCYATDGHVDKVQFARFLAAEYGALAPVEKITHEYMRYIPLRGEPSGNSEFDPEAWEVGGGYVSCRKGRGAKPMTLVDRQDCHILGPNDDSLRDVQDVLGREIERRKENDVRSV